MMTLGIDPGLENTGFAVLDGKKLVDGGVIKTKKTEKMEKRLGKIYEELEKIIKKYQVGRMAVEEIFFAKNARSAIAVAQVLGVIKLCGTRHGLEVVGYTPLQVKMALVGYGRAEKEQVEIMVRNELGLSEPIVPDHASDAAAVGLTDMFTWR
ncbi:crossover junction endodeoxyribonuclease RuvC [Candidatus Shapirobacteria bacterium RBG_13_44_7]|uniref:Crossover junction endodeoxyribonuclease RuvC n=1 Tax=Candidatus Shapirobacteria bacterium RBG_13_44_7 TaxID=1802149 RepID=A0A1F7SEW1_9BACT|nr:MAG: crossover junction endodeoxyribonuclease RuvC [Candidatus Shapirobacteria bacterium RBG_13_44_7]